MKALPFPSVRTLLRVFVRAVALLLVANFVFLAAGIDPLANLYRVNLWGLVGHGRPRLFDEHDGLVPPLPMDAMVASHAIAYIPKAPDEYRVVILGDSAALGWALNEDQHVAAQLTARGLQIGGKRVVAYNLAYPHPNWVKDTLILDAALRYQPDLIIWFISMISVETPDDSASSDPIWSVNRARLRQLAHEFGFQDWYNARMLPESLWCTWIAICSPEAFLAWTNAFAYPFIAPRWDSPPAHIGSAPIPAKAVHVIGNPPTGEEFPNDSSQFLSVGQALAKRANVSPLVVNEPILISSGPNSDVNYDYSYERRLYDSNRQYIADQFQRDHGWYLDLWNVVPAEHFTDTALHMDAGGWSLVVDRLSVELAEHGAQK